MFVDLGSWDSSVDVSGTKLTILTKLHLSWLALWIYTSVWKTIMMSSATILIVVALLSMMPIVRGRQEIDAQQKTFYVHTTGTQTMMFNIPNTEQNEEHESLDDVFLGESLNSLKSLELYASTDDFSINTVAESSDVHSAADSITTRTCNENEQGLLFHVSYCITYVNKNVI